MLLQDPVFCTSFSSQSDYGSRSWIGASIVCDTVERSKEKNPFIGNSTGVFVLFVQPLKNCEYIMYIDEMSEKVFICYFYFNLCLYFQLTS